MDTDAPEFDDEAAQSWQEGFLVANRFRLLRFIGQGGMGKVYKVTHVQLGKTFALKIITESFAAEQGRAAIDLETLYAAKAHYAR